MTAASRPVRSTGDRKRWPRSRLVRTLVTNPVTALGLILVLAFVLCALFAPWIAPHPEHAGGAPGGGIRLSPPSANHPFGTDTLGRDILSRIIVGSRLSLLLIVFSVAGAISIGVTLGMIAGYAPRWVDEVLMRVTDIFLSLPSLILAMLVAVSLGAGLLATVIAITLTYWPRYARIARGETLRFRNKPFVEAAVMLGAGDGRIIGKHLLPNISPAVLVQASLDSGATLLTAAALGFLGLGARPPTPEWGLMVAVGRDLMPDFWWLSAFPGLAIFIVVIALNLVGDGLRSALDPKRREE
jgi:peptide/nickel transport system permease protein